MTPNDVVRRAKRLLGGDRDARNRLNGAVNASVTTLAFLYETRSNVREGAVLEIDNELVYVWEKDDDNQTAEVERGYDGTAATTHADGAVVVVSPRYTGLVDHLRDEMAALTGAGLFQVKSATFDYDHVRDGVDLSEITDRLGILGVSVPYAHDVFWLRSWVEHHDWLRWMSPIPPDGQVTVFYRAPFDDFSSVLDDLEEVSGLSLGAQDALVFGVAARTMMGSEAVRLAVDSQAHARDGEDIPAGSLMSLARNLQQQRDARVNAELARLMAEWPQRVYV